MIVNLLAQLRFTVTSLTNVTTGAPPPQLSLVTTLAVLTEGTCDAQETDTAAGQEMLGGATSFTVITCKQVALFPQTSVAL